MLAGLPAAQRDPVSSVNAALQAEWQEPTAKAALLIYGVMPFKGRVDTTSEWAGHHRRDRDKGAEGVVMR